MPGGGSEGPPSRVGNSIYQINCHQASSREKPHVAHQLRLGQSQVNFSVSVPSLCTMRSLEVDADGLKYSERS